MKCRVFWIPAQESKRPLPGLICEIMMIYGQAFQRRFHGDSVLVVIYAIDAHIESFLDFLRRREVRLEECFD